MNLQPEMGKGNWQAEDLSEFSPAQVTKAIEKTLGDGQIRIKKINKEISGLHNLKDIQEALEIILGRKLEGMRYLVHKRYWTIDVLALSVGNECPCPNRVTIFNPHMLRTA